jgi:hypothetical protein
MAGPRWSVFHLAHPQFLSTVHPQLSKKIKYHAVPELDMADARPPVAQRDRHLAAGKSATTEMLAGRTVLACMSRAKLE